MYFFGTKTRILCFQTGIKSKSTSSYFFFLESYSNLIEIYSQYSSSSGMRTRNTRRKSIQWGRTLPYSHFGGQIRQSKTDNVRLASGAVRRDLGVLLGGGCG